jgi:uncharacterized phage protein gp47/JayE
MSNVPRPSFALSGVVTPAESDIVAGLWQDFQEAFGGALNESPATPQGQLITSLAALLGAGNDLFLRYVNQVDPAFADGRMQDAIARIYYLDRIGAQPTKVTCTCTGAAGVVLPAGSLAQASDGTIFQSVTAATIGPTGSVSVDFAALEPGAIPCLPGSLSSIYRVVPGWDSVSNPSEGVMGRAEESRAEFEERRRATVAASSQGMIASIRGALLATEGVSDAYVTENSKAISDTIGGVTIPAHALYACVQGGSDETVAKSIWSKKPPGCSYHGSTTVIVTDDSYPYPYPSYAVSFQRPAAIPIHMSITIVDTPIVPSDAQAQIRAAIIAASQGSDDGPRFRIGATVYALRFASAITALGPWVQLVSVTVGTAPDPTAAEVVIDIDQIASIVSSDIIVTLS